MSQYLSKLLVRNVAAPHAQSLYVKLTAFNSICSGWKFFKGLEFASNIEIFIVNNQLLSPFVVIVLYKAI